MGSFLELNLRPLYKKGVAGAALHREGQHHADVHGAIFGGELFALWDQRRIKVGGDVLVEDFAFSHGGAAVGAVVA